MDDLPEHAIPLRDGATRLDVSIETLRRRAQRQQKRGAGGPFLKRGDEWFVIVPPDEDGVQDVLRDTSPPSASAALAPSAQFARVIEQAIAPYAARLEDIAIELGATRNELEHERARREEAERERDALRARLTSHEDEPPAKVANDAPGGAGDAEQAPARPQRWPWWMRILGGK